MLVQFRSCNSDLDYAQFTLFFLQNRHAFSPSFSLADSLIHLLGFLSDSQVILIEEGSTKVIGWGHYQFMNAEREAAPDGETAFIHSVFVSLDYRSSRVFLRGFAISQSRFKPSIIKRDMLSFVRVVKMTT